MVEFSSRKEVLQHVLAGGKAKSANGDTYIFFDDDQLVDSEGNTVVIESIDVDDCWHPHCVPELDLGDIVLHDNKLLVITDFVVGNFIQSYYASPYPYAKEEVILESKCIKVGHVDHEDAWIIRTDN